MKSVTTSTTLNCASTAIDVQNKECHFTILSLLDFFGVLTNNIYSITMEETIARRKETTMQAIKSQPRSTGYTQSSELVERAPPSKT